MSNILAFLQNSYTTSQEKAELNEQLMADEAAWGKYQHALREAIATDSSNRTYQVLRRIFGADLCRSIWWANASPRWGWASSQKFEADTDHMLRVINFVRPEFILTFGSVARDGLMDVRRQANSPIEHCSLILCPHPTARMKDKMDRLRAANHKLLELAIFEKCENCGLLATGGSHCEHCCAPMTEEEAA